jgi:simple sugar transport system ATP-binding protein
MSSNSDRVDIAHRTQGCSLLSISHKLGEIRDLCHRATILRGGRVTGVCDVAQENPASMARPLVGTDLPRSNGGAIGS